MDGNVETLVAGTEGEVRGLAGERGLGVSKGFSICHLVVLAANMFVLASG